MFVAVSAAKLWSFKFKMCKYKSVFFEDSRSFSGRVHCTRYQISAGANAPAAPVLDPPLLSQTNTISCGPEFYTCVFQGQYDLFSEVYTPFQMAQILVTD